MSADILQLLIEATVVTSLATIVVMAMRIPMRKLFGARVAYTVWGLIPLALIAVFIPAREIVITMVDQTVTTASEATPVLAATPLETTADPSLLLLMIWVAGATVCSFLFARQQRRFVDSLGSLNPCFEKVFLAENNSQGPAVIGVLQPRIVLPSDFNQRYNREEQDLVLTHEQVHLSRGDTRVNLLATFLQCVFWFNPLLHWAGSRFRFDQELSTDANVLSKFPTAKKSYADAMLKTQMASIGLPVACHWQGQHPLKERILMLKKSSPRKLHRVLGFTLVAVVSLGGAFAAWSTQPANIVIASAETGLLYEMRIDAKIDHVDQARIKLREIPGKAVLVSNGKGERDWSYEFKVTPAEAGYVMLKGKLFFGGALVSEPAMKLAVGSNGSLAVSTKDNSSFIGLNIVVTELRNGKSSPIVVSGNPVTPGLKRSEHFFQTGSNDARIYTEQELLDSQLKSVGASEIATPARMMPDATFMRLLDAGQNGGKKTVTANIIVDQKGFMAGATFDGQFDDEGTIKLVSDLLMKQKYQPAIGKNGEPVPSTLIVPIYDNFQKAPIN